MSVYTIFPDTGNTKLHIFVGLSLPTPCALYSVISCSVHMVYTEMWGTLLCFYHSLLYKIHFFYSERVSSDRLLVDIGSLDVSLDDPLTAKSQKRQKVINKLWRCLHNINTVTEVCCARAGNNVLKTYCCTAIYTLMLVAHWSSLCHLRKALS